MRINYLDILKESGFIIPKNEYSFDEKCCQEIRDDREPELISIINLAFYNMKYCNKCSDNILLFKTPDNAQHQVIVTSSLIICILRKDEDNSNITKQRDFIIKILEDGSIIFKQLIIHEESVILSEFIVGAPNFYQSCESRINGYDQETLNLFKLSISDKNSKTSYIELFESFLQESRILPDISRRVKITKNYSNMSIEELDELNTRYPTKVKNIVLEATTPTCYQALESYIRARDFNKVVAETKGLTNSVEEEIRVKLKIYKTNYKGGTS